MEETRRRMLAGATLGTASAVAAAAVAAPRGGDGGQAPPRQDPRHKHPKPPFPPQSQPWPGLASRMDPRPDHGETSYVGSGRLRGRRALITGGDSGMGRPAAIAFAPATWRRRLATAGPMGDAIDGAPRPGGRCPTDKESPMPEDPKTAPAPEEPKPRPSGQEAPPPKALDPARKTEATTDPAAEDPGNGAD